MISWLKAQIFVGKVVNDLLGVLAKQIGFYENALTPSVGEAPPETLADSIYTSFSATVDVNRDGEITPADAELSSTN